MTPEEIEQVAILARHYWLSGKDVFQSITSDLEDCLKWWKASNNIYYDAVRERLAAIRDILLPIRRNFPYITHRIEGLLDTLPEREAE